MSIISAKYTFNLLMKDADKYSTCKKVVVGAGFVSEDSTKFIKAYNASNDFNCRENNECYKAKLTGVYESVEWTRKYCKAVHAERNLIGKMMKEYPDLDPAKGELYVSRYPCIECARACVNFGFKEINYAGIQEISDEVKKLFFNSGVSVCWYPEIDYEF